MGKRFCLKCSKENYDSKCHCGGKHFISGSNFTIDKEKVICSCGNDRFNSSIHISQGDKTITHYKCSSCNNSIKSEAYN